jgi:DNA invertase Pin-like site-specific DNA recombinase
MVTTRAAVYARVSSTTGQTCDTQLNELRAYIHSRGWQSAEFVDEGHSGAKESRPALDALTKAVHRRQVDVVVVVALDRLGRSLGHLIRIIEDWQSLGVTLLSLRDGLDLSSASGRLQLHVLAALAQFERERVRERVLAGLQRARSQGVRLGRPRRRIDAMRLNEVAGLPTREAARRLGVPRSTLQRWLAQNPAESAL